MGRRLKARGGFGDGSPLDELLGFLRQSHISARNVIRIRELMTHADGGVRVLAQVLLDLAEVKPFRRRRVAGIARRHPELFDRMVQVLGDEFWDDFFFSYGDQPDWLWERWEEARGRLRFPAEGCALCWCGSEEAYWDCCAERDEAYAERLKDETDGGR